MGVRWREKRNRERVWISCKVKILLSLDFRGAEVKKCALLKVKIV